MALTAYVMQPLNRSTSLPGMGMTPSHQRSRSADSPQTLLSCTWKAAAIGCAAIAVFASSLSAKSFEDEYAYITQSFYADLFVSGKFHNSLWLEVFAYDLQPLPKYLIGLALRSAKLPMPRPANAAAWYLKAYQPFGSQATLIAARLPIIGLGALGCVALLGCGSLIKCGRVGMLAALLLIVNPLYRLHAHRAMSDVPCEAFMLAALGLSLWGWRRLWSRGFDAAALLVTALAGLCAGLSVLCKLNGFLGLMIVVGWSAIAWVAPGLSWARKAAVSAGSIVTILVALATVFALNPFLTARPGGPMSLDARALLKQNPWRRFLAQVKFRRELSDGQKVRYPNDALFTHAERTKVMLVQGFGRFGPFGPSDSKSTVRFDLGQDWGMIFWVPLVLLGLLETVRLGRAQFQSGQPPTAAALVVWILLAWLVVSVYLPMAWNRYLLPIQSGNALLAALAMSAIWDRLTSVRAFLRRPECWVFAILLSSFAFFWHSRDWGTGSRLMLTYSLVDRGTIVITGLERQTNDRARFQGQDYSDKPPGFSLLATLPYAIAKTVFRLPDHPLGGPALRYWAADYWITLGTSGVLTAATAVLLMLWAEELGCRKTRAALIGLAYGLATPAYVYATLAYGHQATALALFGSFFLLRKRGGRRQSLRAFCAGLLAAYAALVELQVAPVSAILAFYILALSLRGDRRKGAPAVFALGASIPTLILLFYNQLAFGSPWDMAYFHHATPQFAKVHNAANPYGLKFPDEFWQKLASLLWGRYRGLAFYAPILLLAIPGWVVLLVRRCWDVVVVTFLAVASVLLVNVFYPEWTGGWSTGPRLLMPLIPFAMLPVAALLAGSSRWAGLATIVAMVLAVTGGVEMLLFQGVDGRIPPDIGDPFLEAVWPLWTGQPAPGWRQGERFTHTLAALIAPAWTDSLRPAWQWAQFLPLVLAQVAALFGLWLYTTIDPTITGPSDRDPSEG